jgi:electron transfer flavoprotein alpha subunit
MILGLVEHDRAKLNSASLEMLRFGRGLASQMGVPFQVALIGLEARSLVEQVQAHGAAAIHLILHERMTDYAPGAWAAGLAQLIEAAGPGIVMAAATDRGNEVLAHTAARLGLPMAANCSEVQPGDPLVVTRLRWGGSLLEEARLHGRPRLITIASHAAGVDASPAAGEAALHEMTAALAEKDFRVRVGGRVESDAGKITLGEAKVVVGGGRGVGSAEGFRSLDELAKLMGGVVGCSRAVTSLGWRPHADQIGQTGARIAPEIYIACGLSGSTQHMVGCKGSKRILAVNTDPEAPIVAAADYAIIGDLHQVVPAVCAEIRNRQGNP